MNWFCGCRTKELEKERTNNFKKRLEKGVSVRWTVHFYVCMFFSFTQSGTIGNVFLPWNIKGKG